MSRTPAGAPDEREERVAVLSGDRLCLGCGYNLTGQTIVREPHHRLLIVRCPECGQAASIQEYPLLGRWATRWGVILAALWLILVVAALPLSAALLFGFSLQTAEAGSRRYGAEIRRLHRDWRQTMPPPAQPLTSTGSRPLAAVTTATADFEAWWAAQDRAALLADAGGWAGAVDWRALWIWPPAGLLTFCAGWFWSMVLLHRRRRALLLWALAIVAMAGLLAALATLSWRAAEYDRAWLAGRVELGPPLLALTLGWCAVALVAGMLLGRSLTRGLIRAMLSPRLRAPLAAVWKADGLEPPSTRARGGSG